MTQNSNRIEYLVKEITMHDNSYWKLNCPVLPDEDYDKLVNELRELDPTNELLSKVHSAVSSDKKITHVIPMLSLDKVYSFDDLIKWCRKVARSRDEIFLNQLKYDGVSGDLRDGVLATRGDGIIGEDVSDKLPLISTISATGSKDVRGEILFLKNDFRYTSVVRKSGNQYKNERNAVGGILNRDDIDSSNGKILTLVDFAHLGLKVNLKDIESAGQEGLNLIEKHIKTLDYPADGMVFKIADQEYAKRLGSTRHHSKSEIAYKFSNPFAFSELKGITWSVGKHTITPIGHIEPVEISGVTIKNVNLHNMKNIRDMDIHIGDDLKIERAGDVIPFATGVAQGQEREWIYINDCPVCGFPVKYEDPEIVCTNPHCDGKHLVSLMDSVIRIGIERLGEPTLRKMVSILGVYDLIDIFSLDKDNIIKLEGFAESSTNNLFGEIQKVKKNGVFEWQILASINLEGIGRSLSQDLLKERTLEEVRDYNTEQFELIQGIGPERSKILFKGLRDSSQYINRLLEILPIKKAVVKGDLMKICFTGKFPEKKSHYYDLIKDKGYDVWEKVTKELDILVVADPSKGSSKQKKAEKLGIKVMSISDLLETL